MGYYSDVSLLLTAEAKEKLDESLSNAVDEIKQLFNEACDYSAVDPASGSCFYHWCYSKWGWDESLVITKFLNSLVDEHYSYLRLGEEYGDLEQRGLLEKKLFDPRVVSEIRFNKLQAANNQTTTGEVK